MRRGDNAPIGQTCPMIDDVISTIDSAVEHVLAEVERIEDDELSDAISSHVASLPDLTRGRQSLMERIRSANDELRTWGNEQHHQREEAEAERDALQRRVDDLESEIADLKSELRASLESAA